MTDLPIPFSAPMVRSLLDGTKTQTRRIPVRLRRFGNIREFGPSDTKGYDWHFRDKDGRWHDLRHAELLPYLPYAVGDRLYVREAWHAARSLDSTPPRNIPRDADIEHAATARSYAEIGLKGKLRPAMFMPRWASRITLTVTDVRVQQLSQISEADAIAEVICPAALGDIRVGLDEPEAWTSYPDTLPVYFASDGEEYQVFRDPREAYFDLWDRLNDDRGFGSRLNPWVLAVTFTVEQRNIDEAA